MTVGPGIKPGLLTFAINLPSKQVKRKALAGYALKELRDYRRWGVAPRPENLFLVNGT
jgi:hypothetical protein